MTNCRPDLISSSSLNILLDFIEQLGPVDRLLSDRRHGTLHSIKSSLRPI